jgi:pimeloyl-ACP methyl ester carboxylesterase
MSERIHHRAVLLGARKTLVGVMTEPDDYKSDDRPVFVILNSGIIHRVGHHRMYVTLARALAGAGYQALRFDLSGIGDSESRGDALSPLDGVLADVREVVDWLATTREARRIILVGLCSGADHSLVYAISDPRVCGLVLLDPSIPPTWGYYVRDLLHHLMRPQAWINLATGGGRQWTRLGRAIGLTYGNVRERHSLDLSDPAIRLFLQNTYQRSMDLGMKCLAVFTSGMPHQHNYRRQILDAFPTVPFTGRLQLEYFSGCDHVFTSENDRERLFAIILSWVAATSLLGQAGAEANPRDAAHPASRNYESYEV